MRSSLALLALLFASTVLVPACGSAPEAAPASALKPQETCPIMGGAIDRAQYVDALGKRIYLCCPGCREKVKADPVAALATLRTRGEEAAPVPAD